MVILVKVRSFRESFYIYNNILNFNNLRFISKILDSLDPVADFQEDFRKKVSAGRLFCEKTYTLEWFQKSKFLSKSYFSIITRQISRYTIGRVKISDRSDQQFRFSHRLRKQFFEKSAITFWEAITLSYLLE